MYKHHIPQKEAMGVYIHLTLWVMGDIGHWNDSAIRKMTNITLHTHKVHRQIQQHCESSDSIHHVLIQWTNSLHNIHALHWPTLTELNSLIFSMSLGLFTLIIHLDLSVHTQMCIVVDAHQWNHLVSLMRLCLADSALHIIMWCN